MFASGAHCLGWAALGAVVLAAATPAHGYARTATPAGAAQRWPSSCVSFAVHLNELPGVDPADARAIVTAAASAWTEGIDCTGLKIALDFRAGFGPGVANDGVNGIGARLDTWCGDPGGHGQAVPSTRCRSDPAEMAWTSVFASARSGLIVGADVQLNALTFHWGDPRGHPQGHAIDLQAALMHEIGHALGLAHPCRDVDEPEAVDDQGRPLPDCYDAPAEVQQSVMFPELDRGTFARTLSPDDRRALCEIYPLGEQARLGADSTCVGAVRTAGGGCTVGRRPDGPAAWLLALAMVPMLLVWRRRNRHCSTP